MFSKAPQMVGDLNQDQLERWRDGDESVWDENSKGQPLSQRQIAHRDAKEARMDRMDKELEAG